MGQRRGFTVVELLIVIVIIAILAAITIVGYNGVSRSASESSAKHSSSQAGKAIHAAATQNGDVYPDSLATTDVKTGNDDVIYQYAPQASSKGFCISAKVNTAIYYVANNYSYTTGGVTTVYNQLAPVAGPCPGLTGTPPTVRNYAVNPSQELNGFGYGHYGATNSAVTTARAYSGVNSFMGTLPNATTLNSVGLIVFTAGNFTTVLQPNTRYTVTTNVYIPSPTIPMALAVSGTGVVSGSVTDPATRVTSAQNKWVRVDNSFMTGTSGGVTVSLFNTTATTSGMILYTDGVFIAEGTTLQNFADGNTPGWTWLGTVNNSSSTGPQQQ